MVERDAKGRFVKAHAGGPGRPKKEREQRYLEITMSAVSFSDWRTIIKKAAEQAKRGNSDARKFLAEYLLGKPAQKLEHSGPDGDVITIDWPWLNGNTR